jgi:hypothetical protein
MASMGWKYRSSAASCSSAAAIRIDYTPTVPISVAGGFGK